MSLFLNNIPQASDNLDFSQGELLANNQGLNSLFGIDHYPFVDATGSKGFHNKVTTPIITGSVHPTTTTNPVFYAMQDTAAIGVLQYSKGPNNSQPTPITSIQSPASAITLAIGGTTNLVDMTGVAVAIFEIHFTGITNGNRLGTTLPCSWASGVLYSQIKFSNTSLIFVQNTGNIIQLRNGLLNNNTITQLYWAVSFKRIVV